MKTLIVFLISLSSVIYVSCNASPESASTDVNVADTAKKLNSLSKDVQDFSKLEIPDDSLDLALFNLMLNAGSYDENELLKNAEFLIKKGANPNVSIEYKYSVRKLGTYIPVIKHFYNNKYRHYTATSTAFIEAVHTKNVKIVKKFIEWNADVNKTSKDGTYPINVAIADNSPEIIDVLVQNNCDISVADLSLSKDVDIIEKLVKLGANSKTIDINFALSNQSDLQRLMKLKPDINKYPLEYKKIFSNDTLLNYLLKNGLNSSVKGRFPVECPLIYGAVKYGNLQSVKTLKNAGINVFANCGGIDDQILFTVIESEKKDILNYYLNTLKANPNTKDWTDKSALIIAVETDNDEIIKMLLKAGANIEYTGYFGDTPLMYAVQSKKYIAAETLIKAGANVNFKGDYGETPLVIAIRQKDFAMIKLLTENGADTKIKYKNLSLPEYAKSENAPNMIIEYLKSNK